jgi:hypothetical protein
LIKLSERVDRAAVQRYKRKERKNCLRTESEKPFRAVKQHNTEDADMKKQIVTGLIGAASLLAIAATGASAQVPTKECTDATVTKITAGYTVDWGNCLRLLTFNCTDGDADVPTVNLCVHRSLDADGVLATALTAKDNTSPVAYTVWGNSFPAGGGLLFSLTLK